MQKQVQAVRLEPVLLSEAHTPAELADDLIRIFGMVDAGFPTDVVRKKKISLFLIDSPDIRTDSIFAFLNRL